MLPATGFCVAMTTWHAYSSQAVLEGAEYCFNRQPLYFQNTLFVCDRLHFHGHWACPRSFNIDRYPDLGFLNTQAAEYCPSLLQCAGLSQSLALMGNGCCPRACVAVAGNTTLSSSI